MQSMHTYRAWTNKEGHALGRTQQDPANELWNPDVAMYAKTLRDEGSRHIPPVSRETVYSVVVAALELEGLRSGVIKGIDEYGA